LHRRGWAVNWKRVYRLMGEDNLLCVRKRKFVVTTDSNHGRKVYPNLARQMVLTDVDQLWRADITYIRLREEFVFLAVVLDAYSRRVIGWALDRTLEDELTLSALRMPLSQRVGGVFAGIALNSFIYRGWPGLRLSLTGLAVGFAAYFILYSLRAMGAGDVKSMAAIGALVGVRNWFGIFLITAIRWRSCRFGHGGHAGPRRRRSETSASSSVK
jgi:hypothetical protein